MSAAARKSSASKPKALPLYPDIPEAIVETVEPLDVNPKCERCSFHLKAKRTICMNPEGEPGGALFVAEHPGRDEDTAGRPLIGKSGRYLRLLIKKHWNGPVAFDNAVRCSPGQKVNLERRKAFKHVDECRPYVAATVKEVQPQRIIALGAWAAYSLLGRGLPILSVRKGYGWLSDDTPVFIVMNPAAALRNQFLRLQFEEDLEWALTCDLPERETEGLLYRVTTVAEAKLAVAEMRQGSFFAFDAETTGKQHNADFEVISLALTVEGSIDSWVFGREALANPAIVAVLRELFMDPTVVKSAHNAPFDLHAIYLGLDIGPVENVLDTRLQRRIIQADSLAALEYCAELVGMGGHKEEADKFLTTAISNARRKKPKTPIPPDKLRYAVAIKEGKYEAKAYAYGLLPDDILDRYNGLDTVAAARVTEHFRSELTTLPKRRNIWRKITMPSVPAITQIERWGVAADKEALQTFHQYLDTQIKVLMGKFQAVSPDFNPASPKQVRELLFEKHKLQPVKVTKKTGVPSTDKESLQALRGQHEVIDDLIEFRSLAKLDGTYARGMIKHIRDDGRMHPSFNIAGTETGRLSCSDPNLQNIPRAETVEGKMAKDIFRAALGKVLLQFDYGQLEYRVAAMLSGDQAMIDAFNSGEDFHMRTAQLISQTAWGIKPEDCEKEHRSYAKTINFGLLYGKTDQGLADQLGCSVAQANKIRRAVQGEFKQLAKFIKEQLYFGRKHGGVWVPWDEETARWRPLARIGGTDRDGKTRLEVSNAENSTINTPCQGRASDYMLSSLSKIVSWIVEDFVPAKAVLTVHDSVILEVEPEARDEVIDTVKDIMTAYDTGEVPLIVDVEEGEQWGSLEKVAA